MQPRMEPMPAALKKRAEAQTGTGDRQSSACFAERWLQSWGIAMTTPVRLSFIERFRHWYEYEKDCNAKSLRMLNSVPAANRSLPSFTRAVEKMAHLVAARHWWLYRLGVVADHPESWFPPTTLEQLPAALQAIERRWTDYLARLSEADVTSDFTGTGPDGKRYRWPLVDLLTQVFGHAWYHRGQIAMLVKDLGGEAVDTDYIFWDRPTLVEG
jgi:uncharacterized damage-inducible protein DinB